MGPDEIVDEEDNPHKMAALALIERGFHVFPVKANEKRPDPLLAPSGFVDAGIDTEMAAGWFGVKPKANIGVACGPNYGVVVLDVDVKNGAPGMTTYADLNLGSHQTLTARTPSGGYHLYFKHPGVTLKAKLPGIDIKGADGGGYVLAPPSTLPEGPYVWLDADIPIADFPADLLGELRTVAAKLTNAMKDPANGPAAAIKTPQGKRHQRLVELGAIYRGKDLTDDEIEVLLWAHARRHFEPPFSMDNPDDVGEIEAIVRWYGKKEANSEATSPIRVLETEALRTLAKAVPSKPLLDPPLPEAGSLMIYGAAGIGKSHIGLCVAGALATGGTFLDWMTGEPVDVLYVDGEMPLDELDKRIAAYFGDNLLPRLRWIAARAQDDDLPNLASAAAQELYLAAVVQTRAKVVVFDNLSCLRATSTDLPENSVEAWQPVGAFIRRLNRLGVAVVLVHHASKAGQQRGSTAHVAPMDTVLCLRGLPEGQADPLAENDIEFVFEKHRRFSGEAAVSFRAKAIGDPDGRVTWRRTGPDPLAEDVARLKQQGKSVREIAKTLKRSKAGIEKAISRAKSLGLIVIEGGRE